MGLLRGLARGARTLLTSKRPDIVGLRNSAGVAGGLTGATAVLYSQPLKDAEFMKLDQELSIQFPHLTPDQRAQLIQQAMEPGAAGGMPFSARN